MALFLLRRFLLVGPVLLGVSIVVFAVLHLSPGDPAEIMLGPQATHDDISRLRTELGLDEPLPVQYARWMGRVLQGDLGRSLWMKRPVLGEVLRRFQATVILTASALLLSTLGGIALGVLSAARRNSLADRLSALASLFGASMPSFWLGIVLMVIFALWLGWLPASGMFAPYGGGGVGDLLSHLMLPTITLAAASLTIIARLTRSTMLDVLGQDYVRTARAKGVRESFVVVRHALRNALIPTVTVVGLGFGALVSGAVVVETIFALPGLGRLTATALLNRDYPLIQAILMFVAMIFIVMNLLVDLAYAYLDPRLRLRY